MDRNLATTPASAADNLDELLTDLDLNPEGDGSDDAIIEALDDSAEAAIDMVIERDEAYQAQESSTDIVEAPAESAATPAEAPKGKKAKAPPKPKIERDLSALPDEFFALEIGVPTDKSAVMALRPAQKKVAEKFDNLFVSLAAGNKPSGYTMQVFNVLVEKGEATSGELVGALKAAASRKGTVYSDGTARSQVGQMMNLFAVLKIATRVGNKLTINPDSVLVEKLKAL